MLLATTLALLGAALPASLQKFQEARSKVATMQAVITVHHDDMGEWEQLNDQRFLFTAAHDQWAVNTLGNELGYSRLERPTGSDGPPTLDDPNLRLGTATWGALRDGPGAYWHQQHGLPNASRRLGAMAAQPGAGPGVTDYRLLGVWPDPQTSGSLQDVLDAAPGMTFKEEERGGLRIVTGTDTAGPKARQRVWYINPDKGWNAERIDQLVNGRLTGRTEILLRNFNGTWFPEYLALFDGSGNRQMEVMLSDLRVNDPQLAQRLTPEVIGIWPGVDVATRTAPDDRGTEQTWTGSKLMDHDEYWRLVAAGTMKPDPRRGTPARPGPLVLDPWEQYRIDFDAKYDLNEDQRATTAKICKDAIERRHECKLRAWRKQDNAEEVDERVERLFDEYKERLMRIPTRHQIESCATQPSVPTTAPAAKP